MTRIAVIAAHPDDEALGCGGAIARHAADGDEVHIVFLADGETARAGAEHDIAGRNSAAASAAKVMGAQPPVCLGLPDNRLDALPLLEVVQVLERQLAAIKPEVIYTHHGGDLNINHRLTHQAVLTACRPMPDTTVTAIYGFETASSTEWASPETAPGFRPTRVVDISAQLGLKIKALECYAAEMRPFPHARSMEAVAALAKWRGASVGLEAAEAFSVIREIVK